MKKLLAITLVLTGCGKDVARIVEVPVPGPTVTVEVPGPTVYVPAPPTDLDTIEKLIADENEYRQGLGQTSLTQGLTCTLYTVTGGQYILNDATHTPTLTGITTVGSFIYKDVFNQQDSPVSDGLNVLPPAFRGNPTYNNMIKLRCVGSFVALTTGYHRFDLSSDDGSVLNINGSRLIDNDGNHAVVTKSGQRYLRRGVHTMELLFAQTGAGSQALILKMQKPTDGASYLMGSELFFH